MDLADPGIQGLDAGALMPMARGARGAGSSPANNSTSGLRALNVEAIKPGHLLEGAFRQSAAKIPYFPDKRRWVADTPEISDEHVEYL